VARLQAGEVTKLGNRAPVDHRQPQPRIILTDGRKPHNCSDERPLPLWVLVVRNTLREEFSGDASSVSDVGWSSAEYEPHVGSDYALIAAKSG
jgi:hypothetical protein